MLRIAALILSAGQSTRFGGCKQLAVIDSKPLLQHAIDKACAVCESHVYVVSGAWHSAISAAVDKGDVHNATLINNLSWSDGIGSSIAYGVSKLSTQYDAILILLGDQVAMDLGELTSMVGSLGNSDIICAHYLGTRGVPALFRRSTFPTLMSLTGDHGAKKLLYQDDFIVSEYTMRSACIDIDTKEALLKWQIR
jgi:molybdenum cofactor cytidylyltransferase